MTTAMAMATPNTGRVHLSFWLLFLVANTGRGAWVEDSEPAPKLSSFGTICEKTEIWTQLTGNPTVFGAQNIPFKRVLAAADAQLENYQANIKLKTAELEKLGPRIKDALEREKAPVIDDVGINELIEKALAPFPASDAESSVEKAKNTECGNPKKKDRSVRRVFNKCVTGFKAIAEEKFKGELLFDGAKFHKIFTERVGKEGYCERLCQELRDVAKKAAGKPVPTESPALLSKQKTLQDELKAEEEKLGQCKAARASIVEFETVIEGHKKEVELRHDEFRAADQLWEDADIKLENLEDSIEESKEKLKAVKEQLVSDDKLVTDAKAALDKVQTEEDEVKASLDGTTAKLEEVNQKLDAASEADKVVEELRATVSVATLKMRLFFVTAALQPVEYAGLSSETDLSKYFFPTMKDAEVQMQMKLTKTVDDMTKFCDEEAMPVFNQVKNPDLSPLCKTGNSETIMNDIYATTEKRTGEVKKLLNSIKSWFDPLKGQADMTEEKVKEFEKKGEPEGLRSIMGVYSISKFYKYLKGWSVQGTFLALIAKLKDVMEELQKSLQELEGESKKIKEQYDKLVATREEAAKKLEEAKGAKGKTAEEQAAIEKALETLEEATAKQQKELEDYEAKRNAAYEKFKQAEEKLTEAHAEGVAFLEQEEAEERMMGSATAMLQG